MKKTRLFSLSLILWLSAIAHPQPLPKVTPVDLSQLKPSDFNDEELDLPFFLVHFHQVANAVVDQGEDRGFINISVWRGQQNLRTYNARIMENCLSLAFFYCTQRPWNPYYNDPALRQRLEAALDFWCRMQNDDGKFSEYGPQEWNLAATAFATKFMGETLRLLNSGPPIDEEVHGRVWQAQRKAIMITLTDPQLWEHGVAYSNQYSNVWAGGLAYLAIKSDAELERQLRDRITQSITAFQSPAGYFYERSGPDWGYNLGTHHSNLHVAWHYVRGTDLEKTFLDKVQHWYEWFSYNAVLEPDGSGFTLNRAIETRQRLGFIEAGYNPLAHNRAGTPQAEKVELARAFMASRDELDKVIGENRAHLIKDWPKVPELRVGNFSGFSPYAFLHRRMVHWFPTGEQIAAARGQLPYLLHDHFIHQRMDDRQPVNFTYVRRPGYYAAFNAGGTIHEQQRYGLGLLWHPQAGSLLQSQTASAEAAWGTKSAGDSLVYEARSIPATFFVDGQPVIPAIGNHNLPDGKLLVIYPLGEQGEKRVQFDVEQIEVSVTHSGAFTETLPLLKAPSDEISLQDGILKLNRGEVTMSVEFEPKLNPNVTMLAEGTPADGRATRRYTIGSREVVAVTVNAAGHLRYRIRFDQH